MAGQAGKKAAKARERASNLYYPIIFAINVFFFLCRVLYNFKTFGRSQAFLLAATSTVYYVCYHGLLSSAENGVPGGAYFDIFCVCLVGQFVLIFSDYYGMLVFMVIPAYYMSLWGYWMFQKLREWVRSQQLQNMSEGPSAEDAKRQAKKERKAAKAPKIRMR
ncbi:unnamed protein product [Pylaiella littoralis]